jgi:hypothetical protein
MADFTVVNAGEKLQVGQVPTDFPGLGSRLVPGTAVINGPVYIGAALQGGIPTAACMIGPPLGIAAFPASLDVKGISNFTGIVNIFGVINVFAFSNIFGFTQRTGVKFATAFNLDFGLKTQAAINITQGADLSQAFAKTPLSIATAFVGNIAATKGINPMTAAAIGSKKGFDIPHPTKKEHRLRYICVEGPSAEVYLRGKLKDKTFIDLPEYWRNLVDVETIGVVLTSVGHYQELYVDKIEWGSRIQIKNNAGSAINCDYIVFAERKDTCKNISEYKGLTPADYPGDNSEYVINGKIISE